MKMITVEVLQDFKGSNYGYDSVDYKKGDEVDITESLFNSVKEVQNYEPKTKKPLPVEHWVKKVKSREAKKEEKEKVSGR